MIVTGKFTMISVESRESNGRVYNNVNIEAEDGKLLRLGCDETVINKLCKYKMHNGFFEIGSYKGEMFMRLVDANVIIPAANDNGKSVK